MKARLFIATAAAALLQPLAASAGGLELMPGGTQSLARGGANAARPTDGMAMIQNPAGLALLTDNQFTLNFDIPFRSMCAELYGFRGWGVYDAGASDVGDSREPAYNEEPLQQVCNSAPVLPMPQMILSFKFGKRWAAAFGFAAPTVLGAMQWGGDDGTIATDLGARATPTRYQMIKQEVVFGMNPTAGAAYRILDQLSVGLTLQVGMVQADTWVVQSLASGTSPHDDMMTKVRAEDYFIPAATLSVHGRPMPGLDVMGSFRLVDSLDGPGQVTFTTNTYQQGGMDAESIPFENEPIDLKRIKVGLPWLLTLGVRYSGLLPGETEETRAQKDPLDSERWDVELDFSYSFNARTSQNEVEVGEDVTLEFRTADGTPQMPLIVAAEDIEQLSFDRGLADSVALRLGGSYSVVPRTLNLAAGGFWESRGVDPALFNVDTFATMRGGFGLGLTWRVGRFDLSLAYAHVFQETLEVAPPPHEDRQEATDDPTSGFDKRVNGEVMEDPEAPAPEAADGVAAYQQGAPFETADRRRRVVNAGKYSGSFDILSFGASFHF